MPLSAAGRADAPEADRGHAQQRLGGGLGVLQGGDQSGGIVTAAVFAGIVRRRRRSSSMALPSDATTPSA